MKLPWVSRAAYELVLAQRDSEHEAARDAMRAGDAFASLLKIEHARYSELLDKYQQLRLQGAVETPPVITFPERVVDPLVAAINQRSAGMPASVRAKMLTQLRIDRAAGMSDDVIFERITNGVPADDPVTVQ